MQLVVVLAIQAAQVAGPPIPTDLRPVKPVPAHTGCGEPDQSGDIVVCARAKDADRLPKTDPDRYVQGPLRAETGIFGETRVLLEAEQGTLPNGQTSPRAMVRLKIPF